MTRSIRPIGPVTPALKKHGYRQMAAIYVDGKQVPNTLVMSMKMGDKIKFVGHHIDADGEIHTTAKLADMKRAAGRILLIVNNLAAAKVQPEPDRSLPKPKPAAGRRHSSKPTPQSAGAMIECRGCGTRHSDDTLCPE
jgi:hypothetical protein